MTTLVNTLRKAQELELANGFVNGNLWNELEDMIYSIENPKVDAESGDMYGGKTIKEILKSK